MGNQENMARQLILHLVAVTIDLLKVALPLGSSVELTPALHVPGRRFPVLLTSSITSSDDDVAFSTRSREYYFSS